MVSERHEGAPANSALQTYWNSLTRPERRQLLHVPRKTLFEAIRTRYCSRCFGLFSLRYDELRCSNVATDQTQNGCSSCAACPACQDFFLGLKADAKGITLEDQLFDGDPFNMFKQSKIRERERDIQFMTAGDVCGSGFNAKRSGKVCALHTTCVSPETLLAYWDQLPAEHRTALLTLPRHDFEAELESCCSLQLRICKDCRLSVVGQYKIALAAGRKTTAATAAAAAKGAANNGASFTECGDAVLGHAHCSENCCGHLDGTLPIDALDSTVCDCCTTSCAAVEAMGRHLVNVCDGFWLSVTDASVQLIGSDAAALLEEAEEIEDLKAAETGDDDSPPVRHAETPDLAREALVDAVILIFKAQVEVAFREQTAGHNALLLLVALAHELLEERLCNAALDVRARAAEMELLELLEDERRIAARPSRTRRRKSKFAASTKLQRQGASVDTPQEDSSVLQGASSAASDAAMPTAQELCGAELNGDTALPDATNTSDVCSMGGAISSASWDLGSGIDDGGDDGEWEVKRRGRRSTERRPPLEPPTSHLPARHLRKLRVSNAAVSSVASQPLSQALEGHKEPVASMPRPYVGPGASNQWPTVADATAAGSAQQNQPQHQQQQQQQHHPMLSAAEVPPQHLRGWAQAALLKVPQQHSVAMQMRNSCSPFAAHSSHGTNSCATSTFTHTSADASGSGRSSTEYNLWGGNVAGEDATSLCSMPPYSCRPIPPSASRESMLAMYEALLPASMSPPNAPAAPVVLATSCRAPAAVESPGGALAGHAAWPTASQPDPLRASVGTAITRSSQELQRGDAGFSLFSNFPAVLGLPPSLGDSEEGGKGGVPPWGGFGPKGSPNLHHCLARNSDTIRAF